MCIQRGSFVSSVVAVLAVAGFGQSVLAGGHGHGHGGDFGLVIVDGRVVTGVGDHHHGDVDDIGHRVFSGDFSLVGGVGGNWAGSSPGLVVAPGSMPDGVGVSFVIEGALRTWNGVGGVDFGTVSAHALVIDFGPVSVGTPFGGEEVNGFVMQYTDAGGVHEHFDYLLDGSAAAGIYLLRLRFTVEGFQDSESVLAVFNAGLDEWAHDAAIEYVERVLVPAPSVLAMLGIAAVGARARRRR